MPDQITFQLKPTDTISPLNVTIKHVVPGDPWEPFQIRFGDSYTLEITLSDLEELGIQITEFATEVLEEQHADYVRRYLLPGAPSRD